MPGYSTAPRTPSKNAIKTGQIIEEIPAVVGERQLYYPAVPVQTPDEMLSQERLPRDPEGDPLQLLERLQRTVSTGALHAPVPQLTALESSGENGAALHDDSRVCHGRFVATIKRFECSHSTPGTGQCG